MVFTWKNTVPFLIVAVVMIVWLCQKAGEETVVFRRTFPVMGTVAQVTFYAPQKQAESAFAAVRAEFDSVVALANLYDPESELSRLKRSAYDMPFV